MSGEDEMRLQAEDFAEIYNLYSLYNHCSDTGDPAEYAACFTRDGLLSAGELRVQGTADLTEYKRRDQAGRGGKYRRHVNGSIYLRRVGSDEVSGRCYLQAFNGEPGQPPVLATTGVYKDVIVKVSGNWKFASRTLTFD